MSKKSVRLLATLAVLGGAFGTVLYMSLRQSAQFYMEVHEVMPVADQWYGRPLQLHGFVEEGSILKRPNSLDYRFKVRNGDSIVLASYTGVVPDTFQDGAEVVLKGRLSEGGFDVEPNGVQAKCPSKYEPGAKRPDTLLQTSAK